LVSPAEFIPVAEDTGLILGIGEWVLRTACAQLSRWRTQGYGKLTLAVNLSTRQLRQKDFAQTLARIVSEAGIHAHLLELEITESVLAQGEAAALLLGEISASGVKFSIDDFGTGYSSLSYLKRFPIDTLKIDRSFVHGIPDSAENVAITTAIIAMAHSLGLRVVAEGVETADQIAFLRTQGCDALQGYFLSRPLLPEAFTALLDANEPLGLPCLV
jgi:EAL domain-containing protein (putative c-di-GMP-specific phosphodiesterase class I)